MWKVCNVKKKKINQKSWIVVNSKICLFLSTTLLCKQCGEWESKENFFSSQVFDKEKKKYSPSIDLIATTVYTRDGFQNFQDWRFKSNFININRASTFFIGQSAKETRELEIVRNWEFKKISLVIFLIQSIVFINLSHLFAVNQLVFINSL